MVSALIFWLVFSQIIAYIYNSDNGLCCCCLWIVYTMVILNFYLSMWTKNGPLLGTLIDNSLVIKMQNVDLLLASFYEQVFVC